MCQCKWQRQGFLQERLNLIWSDIKFFSLTDSKFTVYTGFHRWQRSYHPVHQASPKMLTPFFKALGKISILDPFLGFYGKNNFDRPVPPYIDFRPPFSAPTDFTVSGTQAAYLPLPLKEYHNFPSSIFNLNFQTILSLIYLCMHSHLQCCRLNLWTVVFICTYLAIKMGRLNVCNQTMCKYK